MTEAQAELPWVGIAREDAREWWRSNSGAPLSEYAAWIASEYEPKTLLGLGYLPTPAPSGRRLTANQKDILDDVHAGLADAAKYQFRFPSQWAGGRHL